MKLQDIKNSITTISGIGPAAAKLFAKLNILGRTLSGKEYLDFINKNIRIAYIEKDDEDKNTDIKNNELKNRCRFGGKNGYTT